MLQGEKVNPGGKLGQMAKNMQQTLTQEDRLELCN